MSQENLGPDMGDNPSVTTIFQSYPDLFEYLHNLVQDAQASGAVVQIITILPPQVKITGEDGTQIYGCKPLSVSCPKT